MKNILLVEDDMMIVSGLRYALEQEGYSVTHCENVAKSREALNDKQFDLALLDLGLPDGSGFDVWECLKSTPAIFLSAVDDEHKIVSALEMGAADYMTKPFRVRELLVRMKRTLAQHTQIPSPYLTVGEVQIDVESGKVLVGEMPIELTALEYRLLLVFANNKGKILSRTQILDNIWDYDGHFVEDNTLTVYIKRLRQKLGQAIVIETVRGMGYRVH